MDNYFLGMVCFEVSFVHLQSLFFENQVFGG